MARLNRKELLDGKRFPSGDVCPFPRQPTEFSNWEKLTLSDRADLLRALRVLAKKFSLGTLADTALSGDLSAMQDAAEFYKSIKVTKRASNFFRRPKQLPQVCLSEPHILGDGEVVDLLFESHFTPRFLPFKKEFLSYPDNKKVHARMWSHPSGRNLGTIIAIHGWFMGDQRINALTMVPGFFYRLGLNVVLYELPYHGRRAPLDGNGQSLFPSAHLARTNEGFAQAIYELRLLAAWLKSEKTNGEVGAIGMSLGGYTAALWASLDKLAFVIPVVPLVSVADLAWSLLNKIDDSRVGGVTLEELRAIYAVHCPLSFRPKVPRDRQLIIASSGDPIIPEEHPRALWEHWEKPEIHWFDGGHLGQIVGESALQCVHQFLIANKFAYAEPLKLNYSVFQKY